MNRSEAEQKLKELVKRACSDTGLVGVIVYGSYLVDDFYKDIDIALVVDEKKTLKQMYEKRIEYLKDFTQGFDIQIFQLLPTSVKKGVLQGRVLYETDQLYDIAYQAIKDYDNLKKYIDDYMEGIISEN
ncbi:MAG: hypothetical protein ACXAEU_16480 [Candidatus Hodarchaeales archaeon]